MTDAQETEHLRPTPLLAFVIAILVAAEDL